MSVSPGYVESDSSPALPPSHPEPLGESAAQYPLMPISPSTHDHMFSSFYCQATMVSISPLSFRSSPDSELFSLLYHCDFTAAPFSACRTIMHLSCYHAIILCYHADIDANVDARGSIQIRVRESL